MARFESTTPAAAPPFGSGADSHAHANCAGALLHRVREHAVEHDFAFQNLRIAGEPVLLAACRTFIASAPEALLALSCDEYSGGFIAFYSSFCSAVRQKRFRPFGLSVATASAALQPLPMEEP